MQTTVSAGDAMLAVIGFVTLLFAASFAITAGVKLGLRVGKD